MSRNSRLNLESLEGRVVLSDLGLTLKTDRADYATGQPVLITLTETNLTDHNVTVAHGPSTDGFMISQAGTELWRSNPRINPMLLVNEVVPPGQSLTRTALWNREQNSRATIDRAGPLQVSSQVNVDGQHAAPVTIEVGGASKVVPKTDPIGPNLALKVATDRSSYKVGQPIHLTLNETNMGAGVAPILEGARIVTAVARDAKGRQVWQYHDLRALPTTPGTLAAGAVRTIALEWDGKANIRGAKIKADWYTLTVTLDGQQTVTRMRITR